MGAVFWVHFAATWAMIGSVWFVLAVHYPSFRLFSKENFKNLERLHIRRTACIVLPVLFIEGLTAFLLVWLQYGQKGWGMLVGNAFLLCLIWILTFAGCLPTHFHLMETFSPSTLNRLIRIHLCRVILWTVRGLLLFAYLSLESF